MIYKIVDGKKVLIADIGKINPISLDELNNSAIQSGYYFVKEYVWEYDGENWIPPQSYFGVMSGSPDYTAELELIAQSNYTIDAMEITLKKPGWYRISTLKTDGILYYNIILSVKLSDGSLREIANCYHEKYNSPNLSYFVMAPIYFNGNETINIFTVQHNPTTNNSSIKKIERYTNYKG